MKTNSLLCGAKCSIEGCKVGSIFNNGCIVFNCFAFCLLCHFKDQHWVSVMILEQILPLMHDNSVNVVSVVECPRL